MLKLNDELAKSATRIAEELTCPSEPGDALQAPVTSGNLAAGVLRERWSVPWPGAAAGLIPGAPVCVVLAVTGELGGASRMIHTGALAVLGICHATMDAVFEMR